MRVSVGGSDLFVGFSFSGIDSSGNGGNSSDSVLSLLSLDDGYVGGVDGELVRSSVGFVFGDFINVDGPFLSEDLDNFSLGALADSSHDDNFVVFADGK